jgi:predicted transcriptional regulator of viral defense system
MTFGDGSAVLRLTADIILQAEDLSKAYKKKGNQRLNIFEEFDSRFENGRCMKRTNKIADSLKFKIQKR